MGKGSGQKEHVPPKYTWGTAVADLADVSIVVTEHPDFTDTLVIKPANEAELDLLRKNARKAIALWDTWALRASVDVDTASRTQNGHLCQCCGDLGFVCGSQPGLRTIHFGTKHKEVYRIQVPGADPVVRHAVTTHARAHD